MSNEDDIGRIIRLKRYEQPSEEYLEGFLDDFHARQRSELLRGSSRSILMERLATYAQDFGGGRMLVGAGAACLVGISIAAIFKPQVNEDLSPMAMPVEMKLPFQAAPERALPVRGEELPYPTDAYPNGVQKVSAEGSVMLIREF